MAERSCIICREKRQKGDLIRLIVDPEKNLLFDLKQKIPQRGGYLCYLQKCVVQLEKRRGDRKLGPFSVDLSKNLQLLKGALEEQICRQITGWHLQKAVVVGVEESIEQIDTLSYILVASDIAERSRNRVERRTGEKQRLVYTFLDREQLGALLNRKGTVIAGIKKEFRRELFEKNIDRYEELFPQEREWQE